MKGLIAEQNPNDCKCNRQHADDDQREVVSFMWIFGGVDQFSAKAERFVHRSWRWTIDAGTLICHVLSVYASYLHKRYYTRRL